MIGQHPRQAWQQQQQRLKKQQQLQQRQNQNQPDSGREDAAGARQASSPGDRIDIVNTQRFTMLYTHMFYQPDLLSRFMPPYALQRRITILRAPLDVLKSAQKMALVQHNQQDPKLNNSFCQFIAHNTELWLARCPMAANGDGSILEYLDMAAHFRLQAMLERSRQVAGVGRGAASPLPETEVAAVLARPLRRLEGDFIVGMQADFDLSLLLFESALGLRRSDGKSVIRISGFYCY